MTKLLTVSEQSWPEGGGGSFATHLIIDLFSQFDDIETVVLSGTKSPARTARTKYVFIDLLRASNKVQLWTNLAYLTRRKWFIGLLVSSDVLYIPRYCYPLIPLAQKLGKKVIVHLHDYQVLTYNAAVLHNSYGKYILKTARDAVKFELLEHSSAARALLNVLFTPMNRLSRIWVSEADEIVCVSHRQREIIGSAVPELADRLKTVYNPLPDMPKAKKRLGDQTIMYLGGDSYVKGFYVFLRASIKLLKKDPNVKFLLVGNIKNTNRLLIEKLNKRSKGAFNLLGRVKHENILKLYSMSRALLFPSICEEASPYVVLEAMLSGTIPIASRIGGIPEIVQGTYAEDTLFTPESVDEIVDRIESVLSLSKEQLDDIGIGLRELLLKRFDREMIKQQLVEVFS